MFVVWKRKDYSIEMIQRFYKDISHKATIIIFYVTFSLLSVINVIFYPVGFYALYTKKIRLLGYFANSALVTGVFTIFLVYINILFLLVFIMRLVLYTFAKFICNLLISIIVLPRRIQNSQYNTI